MRVIELVVQRLDELGMEQAAETRAADDDDALVVAHQVADRFDLGFAERGLRHDRDVLIESFYCGQTWLNAACESGKGLSLANFTA